MARRPLVLSAADFVRSPSEAEMAEAIEQIVKLKGGRENGIDMRDYGKISGTTPVLVTPTPPLTARPVHARRGLMSSLPLRSKRVTFDPAPGRIAATCSACGRTLYVYPSHFNHSRRAFCNRACSSASHRRPLIDRLMEKVVKQPNGCWRFMGAKTPEGYGRMNLTGDGRGWVGAHVVSYELHIGPVPPGKVLDHVRARGCVFTDCVNPEHLEPVTHTENVRRATSYPVAAVCSRGHIRTPENTRYRADGRIHSCLECRRVTRPSRARQ